MKLLICLMMFNTAFAKELIEIKNSRIKLVPPVSTTTAVFLDIENKSKQDIIFTKIESEMSPSIEFHQMGMDGGKMVMRSLNELKVMKASTLNLKPGGMHIMVFNFKKPLKLKDTYMFTLIDSKGQKHPFKASVEENN